MKNGYEDINYLTLAEIEALHKNNIDIICGNGRVISIDLHI